MDALAHCNNGTCESGEKYSTCPYDCKQPPEGQKDQAGDGTEFTSTGKPDITAGTVDKQTIKNAPIGDLDSRTTTPLPTLAKPITDETRAYVPGQTYFDVSKAIQTWNGLIGVKKIQTPEELYGLGWDEDQYSNLVDGSFSNVSPTFEIDPVRYETLAPYIEEARQNLKFMPDEIIESNPELLLREAEKLRNADLAKQAAIEAAKPQRLDPESQLAINWYLSSEKFRRLPEEDRNGLRESLEQNPQELGTVITQYRQERDAYRQQFLDSGKRSVPGAFLDEARQRLPNVDPDSPFIYQYAERLYNQAKAKSEQNISVTLTLP